MERASDRVRRERQRELASQMISVIIPTWNERAEIGNSIQAIGVDPALEIIVADGGSTDGTMALATRIAQQVIQAPRGRAAQFNAGARQASGEILAFLHADTTLPAGGLDAMRECLAEPGVVGGAFSVRIDSASFRLRIVSWAINCRSRWLGMPFGDQVLFMRRSVFDELRGFRALPIMEDVDLVRRLRQRGRLVILPQRVLTSDRRWLANGVSRTTLVNWLALAMYMLSVDPARIRRLYNKWSRPRTASKKEIHPS